MHRKVTIQPIEKLKEAYQMLGDQYWLFVGIVLVGLIIGSALPFAILMGPMLCGFHLCYSQRSYNKPVQFGLLFKGFDYFVESMIAMLIIAGASCLVILPLYLIFGVAFFAAVIGADGEPDPLLLSAALGAFAVAFTLVIVFISVPFTFVFHLIVDRNMKAIPAVKLSVKAAFANLFGLLQLTLLYSVISMIACCFCYIPAILFLPISLGAIYLVYRDVFPQDAKALT